MSQHTLERRRITTAVAALALTLPMAGGGVALAGDKGKGDERPESAPGQQKQTPAPTSQGQTTAAENRQKGQARRAEKQRGPTPAKPAKPAKPDKPAPARGGKGTKPAGDSARPAGRTTICHATGSATNPYVTITVSDNALKAHARHQDGEDIIPAPAGGCPKGGDAAAKTPATPGKDGGGQEKVTICHATGSDSNPYVKITVAAPAVEAHRRHQHGEDIIPAPEGDCPAGAPAKAGGMGLAGLRAALGFPSTPVGTLTAPVAAQGIAPAAGGEVPAPTGGVLGEFAQGGAAPGTTVRNESGSAPAAAAAAAGSGSLPFTGLDLWVLIAAGLGALVAGVAMFRAAGHRGTA